MKMKAVVLEEFGGAEKLKVSNVDVPIPADNEVQIHIAYTAVNPVDWKIREGLLKGRLPHEFPVIPGWDAAGTVSKVGSEIKHFKVGDEVYAYCRKPIVHLGTYAEYICFEENFIAKKPKSISFAQAAAIPLAGLTAWQSLFDAAHLKKDETILIHAGAGGVGSLAIQFAKSCGARVFTTASKENHDYVKRLGADLIIDYKNDNFVDAIKNVAPNGIDVVFDTIGGETCVQSFDVLKKGGRLVSLLEHIDPALAKQHHITAFYVFVSPNGKQLKDIAHLIDEGKVIAPEIHEMKLNDAAKAQEKNREGHTRGKIVLKVT